MEALQHRRLAEEAKTQAAEAARENWYEGTLAWLAKGRAVCADGKPISAWIIVQEELQRQGDGVPDKPLSKAAREALIGSADKAIKAAGEAARRAEAAAREEAEEEKRRLAEERARAQAEKEAKRRTSLSRKMSSQFSRRSSKIEALGAPAPAPAAAGWVTPAALPPARRLGMWASLTRIFGRPREVLPSPPPEQRVVLEKANGGAAPSPSRDRVVPASLS